MAAEIFRLRKVLILGSAPDAIQASAWPREGFDAIVAINNAWRIRPDWDFLIHPEDFAAGRLPSRVGASQTIITAEDYVRVQNAFGGFVYAGGTMAFTAGYWALGALRPDVLAFFGCDMSYGDGLTHFYGNGAADPLRDDITLQSLEAKSARLMLVAAAKSCVTVNLSTRPDSRLVFPRLTLPDLAHWSAEVQSRTLDPLAALANGAKAAMAIGREASLGYFAPSGRYWEHLNDFDAAELRRLDALWLDAVTNK